MVRRGKVELGESRQALFRELRLIPASHRGNESASRHRLRSHLDRGLHLCDGRRRLETRIKTRTETEQHDVIVVVNEAGNGGPASQIDDLRAPIQPARRALADGLEPAVLNRHLRDDGVSRVHRHDLAVHQSEVAGPCASIDPGGRLSAARSAHESDEQNNKTPRSTAVSSRDHRWPIEAPPAPASRPPGADSGPRSGWPK